MTQLTIEGYQCPKCGRKTVKAIPKTYKQIWKCTCGYVGRAKDFKVKEQGK